MKNNKTLPVIVMVLLAILLLGLVTYLIISKRAEVLPTNSVTASSTSVVYTNTELGFAFSLPEHWKGYTVLSTNWEGNPLVKNVTRQTGVKLFIRNPKWTAQLPYQDIPILVFTVTQWNSYRNEEFSISAAPILATELGRNTTYVFALPPRWNFDYSEGFKEAEYILESKPLTPFAIH